MSSMTFSFGPDLVEDRVWLRLNQTGDLIWISRRLTQFVLAAAAKRFGEHVNTNDLSVATAGHVTINAIEMEHELAISEIESANLPSGSGSSSPVQYGADPVSNEQIQNSALCKVITMTTHENGIELLLEATDGRHFEMRMARAGFHRFLRALWLVASRMEWSLQDVPAWLSRNYLPASLASALSKPAP